MVNWQPLLGLSNVVFSGLSRPASGFAAAGSARIQVDIDPYSFL